MGDPDAAAPGEQGTGGDAGIGSEPLGFVVPPRLVPNDNDAAPLAASLSFETTRPAFGSILVSGGGESWLLRLDAEAVVHERVLLGVKPDTDYEVVVRLAAGDDWIVAPPLSWHTPPLPADFPHLLPVSADTDRMAPGMTMFDVRSQLYVVVVDAAGDIRWYYRAPRTSDRYRLLSNGNIIYVSPDSYVTEIDWFGKPVATWYAAELGVPPRGTIPVSVRGFHHNLDEMPNGNILALCRDVRWIDDYPTSSEDAEAPRARRYVRGDQIVEFTRDGEIAKRYSLFDILDTTRIGPDGDITDWTHSNAVIYDAASDAYLVSMRHQDAGIKLERETGALGWILGNHANWRPAWTDKLLTPIGDEFEWPYHQHAVQVTEDGSLMLYDNGVYRAPAYQTPRLPFYSRAVRFAIDEKLMTATQVWSYQPTWGAVPLFAEAMSDADRLPNGNVLIASGTLTSQRTRPGWAQILEVTNEGDVVFELAVIDSPMPATTFDADRIPDIRYLMPNGN